METRAFPGAGKAGGGRPGFVKGERGEQAEKTVCRLVWERRALFSGATLCPETAKR